MLRVRVARQRSWSSRCWACFIAIVCFGSPAMAQDFRDTKKEILRLYTKGKQLVVLKKYADALPYLNTASLMLEQMVEATKDAKLRVELRQRRASMSYILGKTYELNRQVEKAYQCYQRAMTSKPSGKLKSLLQRQMKALFPQVQVTLTIQSIPSKAFVVVRDSNRREHRGRTPFKLKLPPGATHLQVQAATYVGQKHSLKLKAKALIEKSYLLKRVPARLVLRTSPNNAMYVLTQRKKKVLQGVAPDQRTLPPGEYTLTVSSLGYHAKTLKLVLSPGSTERTVVLVRKPTPPRRVLVRVTKRVPPPARGAARAVGWAALGLAVVSLAGGSVLLFFGEDAMSQFNTLSGNYNNSADADDIFAHYTRSGPLRGAGIAALSLGGVSAIVAVSMFLWDGGPSQSVQILKALPLTKQTTPKSSMVLRFGTE